VRGIKILERVLGTIPIMFGVAIIVFFFIRLTPGDPVDIMMGQGGSISAGELENLREEFHLNEPLHIQLWYFLRDAAKGDLGYSYVLKQPVTSLIGERLPATIELAVGALLFSLIVAFPIGIISAVKQNSWLDRISMSTAFLGISMPGFWLGIILILLFSVRLHWLPVQGRISLGTGLQEGSGYFVLDSILGIPKQLIASCAAIDYVGCTGCSSDRPCTSFKHVGNFTLRLRDARAQQGCF